MPSTASIDLTLLELEALHLLLQRLEALGTLPIPLGGVYTRLSKARTSLESNRKSWDRFRQEI